MARAPNLVLELSPGEAVLKFQFGNELLVLVLRPKKLSLGVGESVGRIVSRYRTVEFAQAAGDDHEKVL